MIKSQLPQIPLESVHHVLADPHEAATVIRLDLIQTEEQLQTNLLTRLIQKHNATLNDPAQEGNGFSYMGTYWVLKTLSHPPVHKLKELDASLHPDMEEFINQHSAMTDRLSRVGAGLFLMIKSANTEQELRDNLPDCLLQYIKGLSAFPRTNEPGYLIPTNQMALVEEAIGTIDTLSLLRFMV